MTSDDENTGATVVDGPVRALAAASAPPRPVVPESVTITTAAEAMRDDERTSTRVFIRLGWLATLIGLSVVPVVHGQRTMTIVYVSALLFGMVASLGFHQAFRNPRHYGPRALLALGMMCVINTHVAILYLGAFTLTPVLLVIGMHFVGRSQFHAGRTIYMTSAFCHGAMSLAMITGVIRDPGVFATASPLGVETYVIGALYVQGAYLLAYYTGVSQRQLSLRSIEHLRRATRVVSQRAALLDELRADLARAQQGGQGRYSDQELAGYRLGAVIGRGAHGEVYDAVAIGSDEPAAVKVLHRDQLVDSTEVARFLREARTTGTVGSSHVVRVLAASEPDAPVPFIAMERLRGSTLADLLRRKVALTRAELVALVTQVGVGLDAVHASGIVHRDLKPQNLFLDGLTWKILDFGIARLADGAGTLTQGGIVGTPHYMAPEQARGDRVDFRTDLYALAAVAYRTLTGRNPFGGHDTPAILYAVIHALPPRPSSLVDVNEDVDRWAALALAKDPAQRPASGNALTAMLESALRGKLTLAVRDAADRLIASAPLQELE